ncbi:MAG: hypothetical protein EA404_00510, partial [Spirochaetaceae bacterium]
ALFCESASRFLVSVAPQQRAAFEAALAGHVCLELGRVSAGRTLQIYNGSALQLQITLDEVHSAFTRLNGELS